MRHLATFTLGLAAGVLLALLLTQATASRQPSAPRPAADTLATLRPVTPLRTGAPQDGTPVANGSQTVPGRGDRRPSPSPTTDTGIASAEPGDGPDTPPSQPTPKPTKRPRATTRPTDGLSGVATWYPAGGPVAAAGPALRAALGRGWRGARVRVCSGGECITVQLIDWCACGPRHGEPTLLDLGVEAFARVADPSAGVIDVTIP